MWLRGNISELIRWIEGGKCKRGRALMGMGVNSLTPIVPKWDALPEFRLKIRIDHWKKIPRSTASMSR